MFLLGFRATEGPIEAILLTNNVDAVYIPDLSADEPEIYTGYGQVPSEGLYLAGQTDEDGPTVVEDDCNLWDSKPATAGTLNDGEWVSPEVLAYFLVENFYLVEEGEAGSVKAKIESGDYSIRIPETGDIGPIPVTGYYSVGSCGSFE